MGGCLCVCATGMHVINSRSVPIISTANKSATNMSIFTASVQITEEADASKTNFHLTHATEGIVTKSY